MTTLIKAGTGKVVHVCESRGVTVSTTLCGRRLHLPDIVKGTGAHATCRSCLKAVTQAAAAQVRGMR